MPGNDGCYRPITVSAPPGTILNPPPDAPVVGGNHETSQRVVDACYKALAHAIPERITAGGPTTSGLLLFGTRPPGEGRRWPSGATRAGPGGLPGDYARGHRRRRRDPFPGPPARALP